MSTGATRPTGKPAKITNRVGTNLSDVRGTARPILAVALDELATRSLDALTGMEAENAVLEARRHASENENENESESRERVDVVVTPVVNLAPLDMNATTLLETLLARDTTLKATLQTTSLAEATAVHRPKACLTDRVMHLPMQSPEEEEAAVVVETIFHHRLTIDTRDVAVMVVVAAVAHLLALPVHVPVTT